MSDQTANTAAAIAVTKHAKPSFLDPESLPWTPWVLPGTHYKLMTVDVRSGGFTLFLKVDPGNEAPPHGHIGAVEGVILKGGFAYDDDAGKKGDYICEHGGAIHQPVSPDGCIMFAVLHGPLLGFEEDGSIAGVIDAKAMYEMASAAGVADHIDANFE
ncbi:2,4'-dihydroxyacetophenone dioxygenase family protein [Rhodobacteraceae bacterium D3-12]|nr:2,4'-dihydroxyacetophenone dioxygenase family protein [Rhodobacteraceae bacterium D3-12]